MGYGMTLIQDVVHGAIPISSFDKEIISSRSFNRLHNVLQNSLAYFVYPSNKTSRFIHSLGVAHISSIIFKYGFINANLNVKESFLSESSKLIDKLFYEAKKDIKKEFENDRETPLYIEDFDNLNIEIDDIYNKLFEEEALIGFLPGDINTNFKKEYLFLLQSLRCAALLHDIGHLPLSHLFEFVLESYYDELKFKEEKDGSLSKEEKMRLEILKYFEKSSKIHEVLGKKLIEFIFDYELPHDYRIYLNKTIDDQREKIRLYYKKALFLKVFKYFTYKILFEFDKDNKYIFSPLHEIISSDLDADRMDYISRDGITSGLLKSSANLERTLLLYTLVKDKNIYRFLPSVRSLKDIEEMLFDRLNLYKYMYFHHKVVSFEYLLEKAILMMLKSQNSNTNIEDPNNIHYIFNVLKTINEEKNNSNLKKLYNFLKIDDFWLFYILRKNYYDFLLNSPQREIEKTVLLMLDEFFSRGKSMYLKSLWKRDIDFYNFIIKNMIKNNENKQKLIKILNDLYKNKILDLNTVKITLSSLEKNDFNSFEETAQNILQIIYNIFEKNRRGIRWVVSKIEREINENSTTINEDYVFVCPYPSFISISTNIKLYNSSSKNIVNLNDISNIKRYLFNKHYLGPLFNVYFSHTKNDEKKYTEISERISKSFLKVFENEVKDIIEKMN